MFAKLLKHDFRSVSRVGKPLTIGALILAVFGLIASLANAFLTNHIYELNQLASEAYSLGDEAAYESYSNLSLISSLGSFALGFAMLFI